MGLGVFLGGLNKGYMDGWSMDQASRQNDLRERLANIAIDKADQEKKDRDNAALLDKRSADELSKVGTAVTPAEFDGVKYDNIETAQQLAQQNNAANLRAADNAIEEGLPADAAAVRPSEVKPGEPKVITEADAYNNIGKFAGGLGLGKAAMEALATGKAKAYEQAFGHAIMGGDINEILNVGNGSSPDGTKVVRNVDANGRISFARIDKDGKAVGALPWRSDQEAIGALAALYGQDKLSTYFMNAARLNEEASKNQAEIYHKGLGADIRERMLRDRENRLYGNGGTAGGKGAAGKGPARDFSPDSALNIDKFAKLWGNDAAGNPLPGMADYYAMATDLALNNPDFQGPGGDARAAAVVRQVATGQVPVSAKLSNDGLTWSMVAGGDTGAQVVLKRNIDPLNSLGRGGKPLMTPEMMQKQEDAWFDGWMERYPQLITAYAAASQSPDSTARAMQNASPTERKAMRMLVARQKAGEASLASANPTSATAPAVPLSKDESTALSSAGLPTDRPLGVSGIASKAADAVGNAWDWATKKVAQIDDPFGRSIGVLRGGAPSRLRYEEALNVVSQTLQRQPELAKQLSAPELALARGYVKRMNQTPNF